MYVQSQVQSRPERLAPFSNSAAQIILNVMLGGNETSIPDPNDELIKQSGTPSHAPNAA